VQQTGTRRGNPPSLRTLWVLVSGLWIVATLLRINRVWAPVMGWHRIFERPWIWTTLIVPPLIFALLLGAVRKKGAGRE
jgi:hypothetical protein